MRWTAKRKAELLDAISREPERSAEIMAEHNVSAEELIGWRRGLESEGLGGLAVKALDRRPKRRAA